ncbi:MAG: ATP-binding protein [Actinomycetota bacterium]
MGQNIRIGSNPLTVEVTDLPPYVIGLWQGVASSEARETAVNAVGELLSRDGANLVLDFADLTQVSDDVLHTLARALNEAQRQGRSVSLVRCPEDLFRRLQRAGATGLVTHAGSLKAATQGLAEEPSGSLDLYLRSCPEFLARLRNVMTAVAREAQLDQSTEFALNSAVTEAATNAIRHGSPEGSRNHVRVSFHLDRNALVVDIADQGRGFDPAQVPVPVPGELKENGYGIHMMREMMDRVEFFQDEQGMLVRMTKFIKPSAHAPR